MTFRESPCVKGTIKQNLTKLVLQLKVNCSAGLWQHTIIGNSYSKIDWNHRFHGSPVLNMVWYIYSPNSNIHVLGRFLCYFHPRKDGCKEISPVRSLVEHANLIGKHESLVGLWTYIAIYWKLNCVVLMTVSCTLTSVHPESTSGCIIESLVSTGPVQVVYTAGIR